MPESKRRKPKSRPQSAKAMEAAGLASMVALLSAAVMLVLAVNIGESFGGPGFSLSVVDITDSPLHTMVVVALNLWLAFVLGVGLAHLTQVPWFTGAILIVSYWLLSDLLLGLLGAGAMSG